jgi:hypothetical protein
MVWSKTKASYSQMWCVGIWSSGVPLTFDCFFIYSINELHIIGDIQDLEDKKLRVLYDP